MRFQILYLPNRRGLGEARGPVPRARLNFAARPRGVPLLANAVRLCCPHCYLKYHQNNRPLFVEAAEKRASSQDP